MKFTHQLSLGSLIYAIGYGMIGFFIGFDYFHGRLESTMFSLDFRLHRFQPSPNGTFIGIELKRMFIRFLAHFVSALDTVEVSQAREDLRNIRLELHEFFVLLDGLVLLVESHEGFSEPMPRLAVGGAQVDCLLESVCDLSRLGLLVNRMLIVQSRFSAICLVRQRISGQS